jgi:hypothetical protein
MSGAGEEVQVLGVLRSDLKDFEFSLYEGGEDFFRGELEELFPDEEILVHAGRGIFDEGFILIGNE